MQKSHLQVTRTYFLEISISILNKYELSIYLSPLEIGDANFKFLFLLSILLFGLSSMPGPDQIVFLLSILVLTKLWIQSSQSNTCRICAPLWNSSISSLCFSLNFSRSPICFRRNWMRSLGIFQRSDNSDNFK